MRVAIDARELQGQPTGVGRYLRGLLTAWATLPSAADHDFVLCAPGPVELPVASKRISTAARRGGRGTLWEQFSLPRLVRETQADVLFAPAYSGPMCCPVPMVVAIHDVSFAARPEWFGWREGLRRRLLTRLGAHNAVRIVTISHFSKGEISRRLGVPESKIDVIYPAATAAQGQPAPADSEHLVLYVGSIFTRRHIPALIDAFARLARQRRDVRLEIVGDNRTAPHVDLDQMTAVSGAADRISLRSYLPDDALALMYGRARAFIFLSEYEGFGLTPLEALAAGVPIVVLDTPVAREAYGDAALYVPTPDPTLIASAIERTLFDEGERSRILAAAQRILPRYSWEACAEQVLRVLMACSHGTHDTSRSSPPAR